jgi:serine/threonine-protein kinase
MTDRLHIGKYRVIRTIGNGGMGIVYEVESPNSEHFALKLFTSDGKHADFLRKRFVAEGKILSRLTEPHLVKVHEIGIDPETGAPYFTMDLVLDSNGNPCTLENLRRIGGLKEERVLAIYTDLRAALIHLHRNGIVHRDIKLENVLINAEGRTILSDFGVSRIFNNELRKEIAVTTTFAADRAPIMGSAGYLSPELKSSKAATPADDAWALGVLVFRLLTGVWYEENSSAMDLIAGFDPCWEELLATLLNSDPAQRLPLPEVPSTKNARRSKTKRYVKFAAICAGALTIIALICARLSAPSYEFDEFFPPIQETKTE